MKIANTIIAYGPALPDASTAFDGSLFYKTTNSLPDHNPADNVPTPVDPAPRGLYVFRFIEDSNTAVLGSQVQQGWALADVGKINAETLDGFSSVYFQPADPDLTALSATTGTGIYIRTGSGTSATRTIIAGSPRITVTNGSGAAGNPTIDVAEAALVLNNISGILSTVKGGSGAAITPVPGGVIYSATASTFGTSAAGVNGYFLLSGGTAAPTWGNPTLLTVGNATNAVNANQSSFASQLTTPRNITLTGAVTGTVLFSGAADASIVTSTAGFQSATNTWTGNQQFSSSGAVTSTNIAPLQPFGAPGAAAYLTFNRVAAYTLNMGLDTDDAFRIGGGSAGDGTVRLVVDSSGNLTATGDLTAFSDLRLKKNVKPIRSALQKVQGLHGVMYERIDTGAKATGLIAQDVQRVIPEAVLTNDDGIMSVSYGNLVGLLVEAIKEQQKQINELKARLD